MPWGVADFLRNRRLWTTAAVVETDTRQVRPDRKIAQNLSKKSAVFDPTDGVESADWARNSDFQGCFMTNLVDFALILLKF